MRLTLKFGVAFLFGLAAVLSVYGWLKVRDDIDRLLADMRRDNLLTGQLVAAAIRELGGRPGSHAVRELLQRAGEIESPVSVRWVSLDTPPDSPDAPPLTAAQRERLMSGRKTVVAESNRARVGEALLVYVPITMSGERGAIEVAEPLSEVHQYTRGSIWRIVTTTAAAMFVCGILFTLIGMGLVGRPINRLVQGFRRVAAGDLAHRPTINQHDELGDLAIEFGQLCESLAEARRISAEESTRRFEAVEQLRHSDRLRAIGQLTAGVAHELGTPLNVVWARASMIARGEVAGEEAMSCAKIIEDQSRRMTGIIRKLLDFARPRPPQKARTDLRSSVRETFEVLGATARKQGVELAFENDEVPGYAHVDAAQIQQVLSNLVLNAIQAMSQGGRVTVGFRMERVQPPADVGSPEGECLCLYVQDTGPGIAEADLPRIFEPFFTTKGVGEGTGLGLSIARGIIREHGGWISVLSRPGEGTCFRVYLPGGSAECTAAS